MIYSKYIKQFGDRVVALVLMILLFPLFIFIFILLLITQGNPVIFVQMRSGKTRIKFKIYKFRTLKLTQIKDLGMENRAFTFFGYFMRELGLDELPQLVNIIKGEMSFVGPRPMPVEYNSKYDDHQLKRFMVKPGITGWAQVHGRNNISWVKRFELDQWYVDNVSILIDIKIVWMTLIQFFRSIFIKNKDRVEMPVFNGHN